MLQFFMINLVYSVSFWFVMSYHIFNYEFGFFGLILVCDTSFFIFVINLASFASFGSIIYYFIFMKNLTLYLTC